ncbi:hypothetical protein ACIPPS_10575 [Streptomyces sp. NPDC090127]|uniref:hypothetical protein n=1 Tax=Streptomyces sp. NPDC090127 TaxID=3365953 RepID=UPI00380CB2F8
MTTRPARRALPTEVTTARAYGPAKRSARTAVEEVRFVLFDERAYRAFAQQVRAG